MTDRQKRPTRRKRGDTFISPGASPADIRCDYAIAPMDRTAREMDKKWGIDRLPELVTTEMAERYGSAIAKLNAALENQDPEECKIRAEVCIRGLYAMDAAATAAGHKPIDPKIWEYDLDGFKVAVIDDIRGWQAAVDQLGYKQVFSLREVAIALKASEAAFLAAADVRDYFPEAEVTAIRRKVNQEPNDPLPF